MSRISSQKTNLLCVLWLDSNVKAIFSNVHALVELLDFIALAIDENPGKPIRRPTSSPEATLSKTDLGVCDPLCELIQELAALVEAD
jgi:hypothetical protein